MVKSILIDDEQSQRQNLGKLIHNCCPELEIIGEANSMESGKDAIIKYEPDLVFLDVEMPGGSGFDLLQMLSAINFAIIFVTAYEKYALEAIRFSALDFLLKPVQEEELLRAVGRVGLIRQAEYLKKIDLLHENRQKLDKIALPSPDGLRFIRISEIIRCQADGNYTWFHLKNGEKILVTTTLKEYDELLNSHNFFRIHHSHLVNLDAVSRYKRGEGGFAILEDGSEIEVSRRRKEEFLKIMKGG